MALPRIDTPTYQTQLPSTGETLQYRPFLVKEQKVIMMAQESQDKIQMMSSMIHLVSSCTFNKIDVAKLPKPTINITEDLRKNPEAVVKQFKGAVPAAKKLASFL